jgi:hypothetical protein
LQFKALQPRPEQFPAEMAVLRHGSFFVVIHLKSMCYKMISTAHPVWNNCDILNNAGAGCRAPGRPLPAGMPCFVRSPAGSGTG